MERKAETKGALRILILAAASSGAESMEYELRKAGIDSTVRRVKTHQALIDALGEFHPDVVLSDYKLPGFDGLSVLKIVRRDYPEVPVIMVTDGLTDMEAVELIHAGAKGYVLKDQMGRLVPTVQQALSMEWGIHERKAAEQTLRDALAKLRLFRTLIDQSTDGIEVVDPVTLRILDVNEAECRNLGYSREEMLDMSVIDIDPSFTAQTAKALAEQMKKLGNARFEGIHRRKDGSEFSVEVSTRYIELDKPYVLSIARDITERKRSEAELLRLNRVLRTLSEGNRTMLYARDEAGLMRDMCDVITASGGYVLAWIGLARQEENKSVEPVAISGAGEGYVETLHLSWDDIPAGRGPVGYAIRSGQTQIVQDIQGDPRFELWRAAATKYGYASIIALPLKAKGQVFGALNIYAKEAHAFSESEVELLQEVANDLAFGIVNLRTRNERDQAVRDRQQYTERLRAAMEDAIQAISTVVEMRDPYTAGHQRRVADLAAAIAQKMGLAEEQVHGLHLAGIVHDLGKIHIPAEILSKPGRLNEIEYSLIKTHSQAGYDILKGIEFPWPIALTVLQHHERVDGSGYPQGLKGDSIILEARILGVADVIESMSSHRPYRPGLGVEIALDEIKKNREVLYDPKVVDVCLKLFLEEGYRLPTP